MRAHAVLSLLILALTPRAYAQLVLDPLPSPGKGGGYGSLVLSSVTYKFKDASDTTDIDRTILAGQGVYNVGPHTAVTGMLGYIVKTEMDRVSESGSGFAFAGGGTASVHRKKQLDVFLLGGFSHESESIALPDNGELELSTTEVHLGGGASFQMNKLLKPYGALLLAPINGGKGEVQGDGFSLSGDYKRDSFLYLRFGTHLYPAKGFDARVDVNLFGEQTFAITGGKLF